LTARTLHLPASRADVFTFLSQGAGLSLKVRSATAAQGRLILRTEAGFLSWGEEITATLLGAEGGGTNVVLDGKPVFGPNITADVDEALRRLADALTRRFPRPA